MTGLMRGVEMGGRVIVVVGGEALMREELSDMGRCGWIVRMRMRMMIVLKRTLFVNDSMRGACELLIHCEESYLYNIFSTISPIAKLLVNPGLSMPNKLINPGKPSSSLI